MELHPVKNRIIVQVVAQKSKSSLILNRDLSKPFEARIIAIGEKVEIPVSLGEVVLVAAYFGLPIPGGTEDEPHLIIEDENILARKVS